MQIAPACRKNTKSGAVTANQKTAHENHHLRADTMTLPKNLGMILLAIFLILFGVLTAPFLSVSFARSGDILAVLAIAAGVALLLQR
jgi:hypothetical protein